MIYSPASFAEIDVRIDAPARLEDLEVKVGPGGAAGVSARAEELPLLDVLPGPHDDA